VGSEVAHGWRWEVVAIVGAPTAPLEFAERLIWRTLRLEKSFGFRQLPVAPPMATLQVAELVAECSRAA
jgi:hypothetical protein